MNSQQFRTAPKRAIAGFTFSPGTEFIDWGRNQS
jgi:hypothetical protein